ncbi:MAG: ABC transporter permease subunit [Alphaproteobacteria bacterium]|nr:ABC transporter permease subunit [Alphaproteobacteria bacterium]
MRTGALLFGYAFLYAPIALLVLGSFNDSRLTTAWSGFSLRWYRALLADEALREAAWLSLRIAAISATGATILGTMAGLALARLGRFPGRTGFTALLAAPLVLPDLLLGLALLLLFVLLERTLGWPGRGAGTVMLAQITIGIAYVAFTVRARLAGGGTLLEQAAADLGAPPLTVLRRITLPLLAPALAAGWGLAFVLSLDDVVVASFVSGPGATTLPMLMFSTLRLGPTPVLNALATVLLALTLLMGWAAWRWRPVAGGKARH